MKTLALLLTLSGITLCCWEANKPVTNSSDVGHVFELDVLNEKRKESDQAYLPFLNVDSMHCGVYFLKAAAEDGQQPHDEDEVYYVQKGKAKFTYGSNETDVKPGTILFVPAKMEHRFHSIKEDLVLLVFFSKGEPAKSEKHKQPEK